MESSDEHDTSEDEELSASDDDDNNNIDSALQMIMQQLKMTPLTPST